MYTSTKHTAEVLPTTSSEGIHEGEGHLSIRHGCVYMKRGIKEGVGRVIYHMTWMNLVVDLPAGRW
jgi:hypothetical protein